MEAPGHVSSVPSPKSGTGGSSSIGDPALRSCVTVSGSPATKVQASMLSLNPPNGTASLCSSAKTHLPTLRAVAFFPRIVHYAVNESTAKAVKFAVLSDSFHCPACPRQGVADRRRTYHQSAEAV